MRQGGYVRRQAKESAWGLAALALTTGCATLTGVPVDTLSINSTPPGAEVRIDGMASGRTPTNIDFDKKRLPRIEVNMPGFQPHTCRPRVTAGTFYVVSDVLLCLLLFPIGCISFIDAGGAWNELESPYCNATFQPAQSYPPQAYPPQGYQPQYAPPQGYPPSQPSQPSHGYQPVPQGAQPQAYPPSPPPPQYPRR